MSHPAQALLVIAALAVPGTALAQCTKDTDCKGDRVCENGACVSPSERQAKPPPPAYTPPPPAPEYQQPPPPARQYPSPAPRPPPGPMAGSTGWEAARKNVITINPLSTLYGALVAAGDQGNFPGLGILQLSMVYERAIVPRLSLFGTVTPAYVTQPGFNPTFFLGLMVGARYYFMSDLPNGFWVGGQVGNLDLNLGLGVSAGAGYQVLTDSGWVFGASAEATGHQAFDAVQGVYSFRGRLGLSAYVGMNF